jgi:murein DD-endopeptidase MepM/ murein hydrolase activator NlpD
MHRSTAALLAAIGLGALVASPASAAVDYPLADKGPVIGTPYGGTHSLGNWESDNAIDISVPVGTAVYAVADGTVSPSLGYGDTGKGGRFAGARLHLVTGDNVWFYTHLSKVTVDRGQTVKRGQKIGESGAANGSPHLHISSQKGDPRALLGLDK